MYVHSLNVWIARIGYWKVGETILIASYAEYILKELKQAAAKA